MIEQQQKAKNAEANVPLTARQLYQHDPLLVLLKDRWHGHTWWMCAGVVLLPASVFLFWWFAWARMVTAWNIGNTLSVLLQTLVLFPVIFLIYVLVPDAIAKLFNTLKTNGVIGKPRVYSGDATSYETFVQNMVRWTDNSGWTLAILVLVVCYALYRLLLLEPTSLIPVPYGLRVCAILIYLPLMYVTGMSVIRIVLALLFTN